MRQVSDKQLGKKSGKFADEMRAAVLAALTKGEERSGKPLTRNEVVMELEGSEISPHLCWLLLMDLWRNDEIIADRELNLYSANPKLQSTATL